MNTDSKGTDTDSVVSVFANGITIKLNSARWRLITHNTGTTQQATKQIISSFFMNQTFPENWFRAAAPVLGSPIPGQIAAALSEWVPGHNDENGVFVADPQAPVPFNISSVRCLRSIAGSMY